MRRACIILAGAAALRPRGATRSTIALLRAGDFETLARSFDGPALALTLPTSRTRCVVLHEDRADLIREACGASWLADRVGGANEAFPGLTRQREGPAWRAARRRVDDDRVAATPQGSSVDGSRRRRGGSSVDGSRRRRRDRPWTGRGDAAAATWRTRRCA